MKKVFDTMPEIYIIRTTTNEHGNVKTAKPVKFY